MARPWKHPKTGVYWYRKVVPAHLRAAIGKTEIKRSLSTKDPEEAKRRYPDVAARVDAMLLAAQYDKPARLNHRQLLGLVGDWYRAELAVREEDPTEVALQLDRAALIAALEPDPEDGRPPGPLGHLMIPDDAARKVDEDARIEAAMQPHVDRLLIDRGLFIDAESRSKLARTMFKHALLLNMRVADRLQEDYSPDPVANRLPSFVPSVTPDPEPGPSLAELIEGWARDAAPTPDVKRKFTYHLRLLAQHLGTGDLTETDALRIRRKDVIAFKEAELQAGKAPKTVWSELAGIGAVLSWAAKNDKIRVNPASNIDVPALKAAKRRGEKPRYPYTPEEAETILKAARSETAPDLRWLPWLCAFTGARIGEVAGVCGKDIHAIDGQWFIAIGLDGRRVKTGSSRRRVPLHPVLVAEEFLTYAQTSGCSRPGQATRWPGGYAAMSGSRTPRKAQATPGAIASRTKAARLVAIDLNSRRTVVNPVFSDAIRSGCPPNASAKPARRNRQRR
ncbi:MAG: DUF6538 domain-containing protein [Alphaproteobacteria bacterium]